MKDLTDSSIVKNILQMALPIAAGMFFQTLYFLIDLYFVAGLGDAAIAGVGEILSMYVGREEVLVTLQLAFAPGVSAAAAAVSVADLQREVQLRYPMIQRLYVAMTSAGAAPAPTT